MQKLKIKIIVDFVFLTNKLLVNDQIIQKFYFRFYLLDLFQKLGQTAFSY